MSLYKNRIPIFINHVKDKKHFQKKSIYCEYKNKHKKSIR